MKRLFAILSLILGLNTNAQQIVELCPDLGSTFTYTSNTDVDGIYTWTVGPETFVGNSFTYNWTEEGEYTIYLDFISDFGCVDTISYDVSVIPCQETYFYVPNSFTPNNDAVNDVFNFYGYNYNSPQMFIFNRWGELLFQSETIGWDGTYKNNLCQDDVYVYMIRWYDKNNKFYQKIGHVTLLR